MKYWFEVFIRQVLPLLVIFLLPTTYAQAQSTSSWNFCANEDGVCNFTGTTRVRYGVTGKYNILTKTDSTPCNNATFSDPAPGFDKTCEYETVLMGPPPNWITCAVENSFCSFTGTAQVRYGVTNRYVTNTFTNGTPCTNAVFGDPAPGFDKTCSYAQTSPPQPPPPVGAQTINTIENAKTGTTSWELINPATQGEIEGYASATSVNRGSAISFYVNTSAPTFTMDIFRMGYYGGAGARKMLTLSGLTGMGQSKPCVNPNGVIECNWRVQNTLIIPANTNDPSAADYWPSGVYLAKLSTSAPVTDSYIIFVVRDDDRVATYLEQLPITTYQAYNFWGGKSLYTGCTVHDVSWRCSDGSQPSPAVSFNRPFGPSNNPAARFGVGAGEFITNVQPVTEGYPITSAGFDYNMLRWIEAKGYDTTYASSLDLHERPSLLTNIKAFVSTGHDEYYSKLMRDRLVNFRDNGKNLLFFSSNQAYWQVRFANGSYGPTTTNRIMICYRNGGDPVQTPGVTTGKFRDLGNPEAAFIGSQYVADPVTASVSITNAEHWLMTASGATNTTTLPGLLGYEINAIVSGISPANTVSLANSISNGISSDMSFYLAPSQGLVIATGTMQWSWGLDNYISNNVRPDYANVVAQKITTNFFSAAGEADLFTLKNSASGLFLGTLTGSTSKGQTIVTNSVGKNRLWRIKDYGDTTQQLVARATAYCLDAYGISANNIAGTWECNNAAQQHWRFIDQPGGTISIKDQRAGLCLASTSTATEGSGVTIQTCTNAPEQQWRKTPG